MSRRTPRPKGVLLPASRLRRPALVLALVVTGSPIAAQDRREQDELDFGRVSMAVGSGARAMGMGGAFLARADDATAASWNPAGLSYLRTPEVSLVGLSLSQDLKTRGPGATLIGQDHTNGTTPDFLSMAVPVSLGAVSGAVQLSFQRVVPYTGHRTIEELTDPPKEIEASGGFDVLALGTGLKLTRWLRAGLTVNRWMNGFHQTRERLLRRRTLQEVDFRISGYSFNAGLIAHPHENVNVGLVAKTRMAGSVELSRERTDFTSGAPGEPDNVTWNRHDSDEVRLDLPGAVGLGASWRPTSPLTLSGDYTRTFWSRSRLRNYFTLPPGNLTGAAPPPEVFATLPYPDVRGERQSDTEEFRLGVEYVLIGGSLKLPLRGGYFREKQYRRVSDGSTPTYSGLTGGAGLVMGPVMVDLAYVYQWGRYGEPGVAEVTVRHHRGLVSLIYRHGG